MATGALEKLEGMRSGVQPGGSINPIIIWLVIILALVLIVVLLRRLIQKQRKSVVSGIDGGDVDDLDLDEEETTLLQDLANRISITPEQLIRDKKAFEYAVHDYLSNISDFFPRPRPECEQVANLRRSLDFVHHESALLHSTRGMHVGDTLRLNVAYQPDSDAVEARVRRVGEDFLELEVDGDIQVGDEIVAVAFVSPGRYSFSTRVARVSDDGKRCLVEHTMDLQRRERRSSRRVETMGPVYCRPRRRPDAEWQEMETLDLSEGGVRLHGERIVVQGTDENANEMDAHEVEVRFLPEKFFSGDFEDENMSQWLMMPARVVDIRHLGVDDYEYRMSFVDIERPIERQLSKMLYMLETREKP